jgi:D-serine deaminase-like pyridoxal phosphate-dependent protein
MEGQKGLGTSKWDLDTPCLVIDEEVLDQNIRVMQAHVKNFGKQLRPHAKTHKCTKIVGKQMAAGCVGICVAKVSEAEVLVEKGFRKILITSPLGADAKIHRFLDCVACAPEIMGVVDSSAGARRLNEAAEGRSQPINVLLDLDPGMGRTGIPFREALDLGIHIHRLPFLRLRGVQCYAGHVQHISSFQEREKTSLKCMHQAADVFRQFRESELPGEILTGSGTGTFDIDCRVSELTDLQTGSYTLMDAEYLNIGSSLDPSRFVQFPPALTLLTMVISANHSDFVTVDAGLKALYHHGANPTVIQPAGSDLTYEWWGDEHGKIRMNRGGRKPVVGEVIELAVSHCDPTVNLFDAFHVIRDGILTDIWPIDMRGRCQ